MHTIEDLQAALVALREEVRALEARLDGESGRRRGLMRDTRRCPVCDGTRILLIEWFQNIITNTSWGKFPISASIKTRFGGATHGGVLQAFACGGCGHAEMQLEGAAALEAGDNIRALEPPEEGGGPYR